MAYFICHGIMALTLSNMMHKWGLCISHYIETRFYYNSKNFRIMGFKHANGGQGGNINVHWERWKPRLGPGSCIGLVHSQPCFLCSTPAWCNGVKLRWINRYAGNLVYQHHHLLVQFGYHAYSHRGHCFYVASCRVWRKSWFMGIYVGKAIPIRVILF